jgi:hypothetical protein
MPLFILPYNEALPGESRRGGYLTRLNHSTLRQPTFFLFLKAKIVFIGRRRLNIEGIEWNVTTELNGALWTRSISLWDF